MNLAPGSDIADFHLGSKGLDLALDFSQHRSGIAGRSHIERSGRSGVLAQGQINAWLRGFAQGGVVAVLDDSDYLARD